MAEVKQPFPRSFYFANAIELFERLAFYGFYINLTLFLRDVVGMDAIATGVLTGTFRSIGSFAPIPCGAIADRISFKRSLMIAFSLYALAYGSILVSPTKAVVIPALFLSAIAGGFMKPVILGIVARTSPPERVAEGYGVFYRMVNSGSVVGKTLAYVVRHFGAIRFVLANSAIASLISLGIATFLFEEPKVETAKKDGPAFIEVLRGYWNALKNWRFTAFLIIFAGYYFMAEQFYMTFPTYVKLHIDEKAPLRISCVTGSITCAPGSGCRRRRRAASSPAARRPSSPPARGSPARTAGRHRPAQPGRGRRAARPAPAARRAGAVPRGRR